MEVKFIIGKGLEDLENKVRDFIREKGEDLMITHTNLSSTPGLHCMVIFYQNAFMVKMSSEDLFNAIKNESSKSPEN